MKKMLIISALAIAVCGCSAKIGNSKLGGSESRIEKQMQYVSDKSDARKTFGTPNLIFDKDNAEVYEYKTISGAGRYHWMIPVVGWVTSWWQDAYTYTETNLFIAFDKNDKVRNWNVVRTGGTTN
jgi:hypothetical protein